MKQKLDLKIENDQEKHKARIVFDK